MVCPRYPLENDIHYTRSAHGVALVHSDLTRLHARAMCIFTEAVCAWRITITATWEQAKYNGRRMASRFIRTVEKMSVWPLRNAKRPLI